MTGYLERPPLAPDQCRMTVLAAPSPSVSAPDADPRPAESVWSKPAMSGMILLAMAFGWLLVSLLAAAYAHWLIWCTIL
jgi:hypothetical protein